MIVIVGLGVWRFGFEVNEGSCFFWTEWLTFRCSCPFIVGCPDTRLAVHGVRCVVSTCVIAIVGDYCAEVVAAVLVGSECGFGAALVGVTTVVLVPLDATEEVGREPGKPFCCVQFVVTELALRIVVAAGVAEPR